METPPVIDPHPGNSLPPAQPANLARAGLILSLVAPVVILLMLLLQPG